jgi:hypothetical protein
MKNILAENMLRFGVKNLSESTIKQLHEQHLNEAPPVPTGSAQPGAAPAKAPQNQRVEQIFRVKLNAKGATADGKVIANIPMVQGKAQTPSKISIQWPKPDGKVITLSLTSTSKGQYDFDTREPASRDAKMQGMDWPGTNAANILGPQKPLTALNAVIAAINKQTGGNWSAANDVVEVLSNARSGVQKYATVQLSAAIGLKDGSIMPYKTAGLTITYDPETNKEIDRDFTIGLIPIQVNGTAVGRVQNLVSDMIKKQPERMAGRDSSDIQPDVQAAYNAAMSQIK